MYQSINNVQHKQKLHITNKTIIKLWLPKIMAKFIK